MKLMPSKYSQRSPKRDYRDTSLYRAIYQAVHVTLLRLREQEVPVGHKTDHEMIRIWLEKPLYGLLITKSL